MIVLRVLTVCMLIATLASPAAARCRCRPLRVPKCATPEAKHRIRVEVDLTVADGTVEVITQSGPYHVPVSELDGKTVLAAFMPRGEVFQGFFEEIIAIAAGTMDGPRATVETAEAFLPGEYEVLLFVDAAAGGGGGPQRGDLAAFDNGICDPTGVSVRAAVGCGDATLTLTNRHFILF
jgi:hypothetical protein